MIPLTFQHSRKFSFKRGYLPQIFPGRSYEFCFSENCYSFEWIFCTFSKTGDEYYYNFHYQLCLIEVYKLMTCLAEFDMFKQQKSSVKKCILPKYPTPSHEFLKLVSDRKRKVVYCNQVGVKNAVKNFFSTPLSDQFTYFST